MKFSRFPLYENRKLVDHTEKTGWTYWKYAWTEFIHCHIYSFL